MALFGGQVVFVLGVWGEIVVGVVYWCGGYGEGWSVFESCGAAVGLESRGLKRVRLEFGAHEGGVGSFLRLLMDPLLCLLYLHG